MLKLDDDSLQAELVRRFPPRKRTGLWNQTEMDAAHSVAMRALREGAHPIEIATSIAAYRERIIERILRGGDVEDLIADIRAGVLR